MLISLKNDRLRDKERKREVESLLGGVDDERFNLLVNLGKKITDWSSEELNKQARNGQGNLEDEEDAVYEEKQLEELAKNFNTVGVEEETGKRSKIEDTILLSDFK